jgi:hypothetical protein
MIAAPQVLARSQAKPSRILELGALLWQVVNGVYGFIDVDTGVPLRDDLFRNIDFLYSNLLPPEHAPEFRMWQQLMHCLNRRVWKAFWGNFLGDEHLQEMGGVRDMQRADPRYRRLPEYEEAARQAALLRLRACPGQQRALANRGVLVTLSDSPLDWFDPDMPQRVDLLQSALGRVALGAWDGGSPSPCDTR